MPIFFIYAVDNKNTEDAILKKLENKEFFRPAFGVVINEDGEYARLRKFDEKLNQFTLLDINISDVRKKDIVSSKTYYLIKDKSGNYAINTGKGIKGLESFAVFRGHLFINENPQRKLPIYAIFDSRWNLYIDKDSSRNLIFTRNIQPKSLIVPDTNSLTGDEYAQIIGNFININLIHKDAKEAGEYYIDTVAYRLSTLDNGNYRTGTQIMNFSIRMPDIAKDGSNIRVYAIYPGYLKAQDADRVSQEFFIKYKKHSVQSIFVNEETGKTEYRTPFYTTNGNNNSQDNSINNYHWNKNTAELGFIAAIALGVILLIGAIWHMARGHRMTRGKNKKIEETNKIEKADFALGDEYKEVKKQLDDMSPELGSGRHRYFIDYLIEESHGNTRSKTEREGIIKQWHKVYAALENLRRTSQLVLSKRTKYGKKISLTDITPDDFVKLINKGKITSNEVNEFIKVRDSFLTYPNADYILKRFADGANMPLWIRMLHFNKKVNVGEVMGEYFRECKKRSLIPTTDDFLRTYFAKYVEAKRNIPQILFYICLCSFYIRFIKWYSPLRQRLFGYLDSGKLADSLDTSGT